MTNFWRSLAAAVLLILSLPSRALGDERELIIFGAASLTNALHDIGADFTKKTGRQAKFSFAASSALARQIEAGTRADVFMSADQEWMDYLQKRNLINRQSRRDVVGNRLVLIAPADNNLQLKIAPHFALAAALGKGRLATGDPDSVPVGRYARTALMRLGVWDEISDHIAPTEDVRSALAFVARGEAVLGIVYTTDALIETRVRIVDTFPQSSHPPITYPVALLATAQPGAQEFIGYLLGPAGRAIFARYGFEDLH